MPCRHHDIQVFDGLQCCLACGETVFSHVKDPHQELPRPGDAPYEYAQLNYSLGQEIRLCVLFAGHSSEDLVIDLVHINIRHHPPYEAISYAWATQDGDDALSCKVQCHGGTIPVTKTCDAALRRLRFLGRSRYLWVDAICIDQSNITERNHQVGFMGTIFSNASQVMIYLGPGTPATDVVLDHLNGTTRTVICAKRDFRYTVEQFLNQRWFDRVWILQEIALAKLATMIAGGKTVRWTLETVNKLLALCTSLSIEPPSALRWLPASQPEHDILCVLQRSRNCSSTDPRDKVFAVLGLAQEEFQHSFPIDYSLTVEDVYTQLAMHLFYTEGSLRFLKHASGQGETSRKSDDIPSWVPQWDVKSGYTLLPRQFRADELDFLASTWSNRPSQSGLPPMEMSNKLLQKYLKDLPDDQEPLSTDAWLQSLRLWLDCTRKLGSSVDYDSVPDLEDASLCLSRFYSPDFRPAISQVDTKVHSWEVARAEVVVSPSHPCLRIRAHLLDSIDKIIGIRSYHHIHHFRRNLPRVLDRHRLCSPCSKHFVATSICQHTPTVLHTMSEEFDRDMKRVLDDRNTMFETKLSVGVARGNVRINDNIYALDGIDVPFVLRKTGQHYVLIGECFLYRALRHSLCTCCGIALEAWPIVTKIIDVW